jgi:hypothetical protein
MGLITAIWYLPQKLLVMMMIEEEYTLQSDGVGCDFLPSFFKPLQIGRTPVPSYQSDGIFHFDWGEKFRLTKISFLL